MLDRGIKARLNSLYFKDERIKKMTVTYKIGEKDTRPWGDWEVIDVGPTYIVKRIRVLPDKKLSLQLHHHRDEHWIIAQGTAQVTLGEKVFDAPANTPVFIPVGEKHRIANLTQEPVVFIEVQTGDTLDETDIVRLEDSYGRV